MLSLQCKHYLQPGKSGTPDHFSSCQSYSLHKYLFITDYVAGMASLVAQW